LSSIHTYQPESIAERLMQGDLVALSKAITLIESTKPEYRKIGEAILALCKVAKKQAVRVGITGVPGVGKSTFIESFGLQLIASGHKVAVLAIDPSSKKSGGSILGDKTRMNALSIHPHAFIRPSSSGLTLGGVGVSTREVILLCEAAGYDRVIIETVGVGQSETTVKEMSDVFLLLMLSGAGDDLQGIKRGIMEMSDILAITKADGDNVTKAKMAAAQYKQALHLMPAHEADWLVPVLTCSAYENAGIAEIENTINDFISTSKYKGWFEENRRIQNKLWLDAAILNFLNRQMNQKQLKSEDLQKVMNGEILPHEFIAQHLS
jgi:LAO/AO transport system kinase